METLLKWLFFMAFYILIGLLTSLLSAAIYNWLLAPVFHLGYWDFYRISLALMWAFGGLVWMVSSIYDKVGA